PVRPDPKLMADFLRALIGTTQVKGGYYTRKSQDCAIAGFVERLEPGLHPLPPLPAADFAAPSPRERSRSVVVTGVSGEIGLAIARAYAAPGATLCLVGSSSVPLDRAATDCRYRGAVTKT